ncbi:hypothetical protein J4714_13685 [Staphylococcus epidermidis]|nr:hypothetical protein [Staphylococcus epidermidis]
MTEIVSQSQDRRPRKTSNKARVTAAEVAVAVPQLRSRLHAHKTLCCSSWPSGIRPCLASNCCPSSAASSKTCKRPTELDKELSRLHCSSTRSGRYLAAMASGQQRHDLSGQPVEATLPEHVHHALIESSAAASSTPEDLTPKLRNRIIMAYEASGLSRESMHSACKAERGHQHHRGRALAEAEARAARTRHCCALSL